MAVCHRQSDRYGLVAARRGAAPPGTASRVLTTLWIAAFNCRIVWYRQSPWGRHDRAGRHAKGQGLLRPLHRTLRHHCDGRGRRFTRLDPDPSTRPAQAHLRQGTRSAGAGLSQGPPDPSAAADAAQGRCRSGLGGDLLGRGAGRDRRGHAPHRGRAWAAGRRLQPVLTIHHRDRRLSAVRAPPDECIRHAEPGLGARPVRLGARLRDALRLRRRQRRHRQRRRRHGGYRALRLPDPVGLQSVRLPSDACHRDGRGAEARHEADRRRSAPVPASPTRRISGCACGPAPMGRWRSGSPIS